MTSNATSSIFLKHSYKLKCDLPRIFQQNCHDLIYESVSKEIVREWFDVFETKSDFLMEDIQPKYYNLIVYIYDKYLKQTFGVCKLEKSKKWHFLNERYVVSVDMEKPNVFNVMDLFYGIERKFPITNDHSIKMNHSRNSKFIFHPINNQRFLFLIQEGHRFSNFYCAIHLIEFKWHKQECKILCSQKRQGQCKYLIPNQKKDDKLICVLLLKGFLNVGELKGVSVMLEEDRILLYPNNGGYDEINSQCYRLEENTMSAISLRPVRFNEIYELRKMTINNHFDNEFTSQFVFQDCHLIDSSRFDSYKWVDKVCYVQTGKRSDNNFTIKAFDIENQKCLNVNIFGLGKLVELYVNINHLLMIRSGSKNEEDEWCYRYCLKKPDELLNLTWLEIRRQAQFYGNKKLYEQALKALPIHHELRPFCFN